jgi:hypothetical protein
MRRSQHETRQQRDPFARSDECLRQPTMPDAAEFTRLMAVYGIELVCPPPAN